LSRREYVYKGIRRGKKRAGRQKLKRKQDVGLELIDQVTGGERKTLGTFTWKNRERAKFGEEVV